jgi:hypothetical protein
MMKPMAAAAFGCALAWSAYGMADEASERTAICNERFLPLHGKLHVEGQAEKKAFDRAGLKVDPGRAYCDGKLSLDEARAQSK